jgi:hypothetical protein
MEAQAGWEHINLREIIFGKEFKSLRENLTALNGRNSRLATKR